MSEDIDATEDDLRSQLNGQQERQGRPPGDVFRSSFQIMQTLASSDRASTPIGDCSACREKNQPLKLNNVDKLTWRHSRRILHTLIYFDDRLHDEYRGCRHARHNHVLVDHHDSSAKYTARPAGAKYL